ncbi:protein of unknown function [Methylorubrum extorquens]|uniref:Uncharacterized protein n=1 Tax=Methylorubrum extorquens TaxID=408 RepID=A0A2N9AYH4_METEX|nr:protein of unknown function [Methylorubrum extorquens]
MSVNTLGSLGQQQARRGQTKTSDITLGAGDPQAIRLRVTSCSLGNGMSGFVFCLRNLSIQNP